MATIQIRDIPDEDYETLRMAARAEGKSLQAYLREAMIERARHVRKAAMIREMQRITEPNRETS
ncbi:FitA-like ribbon-helix-helix domain-containing protein [Saccharopolyspora sp. 5N708]|uniref:FitA-like ribbon-helix-helix domain-containing protein n=1 Tax=Saccharopolyspora sp. 5N708 TaxID=3457424 RepID=UPI003FD15DD4